jgi:hypothetical protein
MKGLMIKCAAALPLLMSVPGIASADFKCKAELLKGQYVFTATGFTRAPNSAPGTAWAPKAIVEVIQFNGDGTLTTPGLTLANPVGDTGAILQPPTGGAPGAYTLNEDCSGTVQFFDPANTAFKIVVDSPWAITMWMIQTNPANNVFQGSARRVR